MNAALFSSATCEWETPQDFFDKLNEQYHFELDACATPQNAKCKNFFTRKEDALLQNWGGWTTIWCNPPYGKEVGKWVQNNMIQKMMEQFNTEPPKEE